MVVFYLYLVVCSMVLCASWVCCLLFVSRWFRCLVYVFVLCLGMSRPLWLVVIVLCRLLMFVVMIGVLYVWVFSVINLNDLVYDVGCECAQLVG